MSAIAAELLKLRRSRGTWVLVGVLALVQLLLGYALLYLVAGAIASEGDLQEAAALELSIRPEFFVSNVLGMLASIGGALALVLGAMHSAREYGWRTVTNMLTQGPSRVAFVVAKAVSLGVVVVLMVLVTFATGAIGSAIFGSLSDAPLEFPPFAEIASGIVVGSLIVGAWAALGLALGFLLRSTGLAIGLGLVYALVIETIVNGFATLNDVVEAISRGLLGTNGSALASSFAPAGLAEQFGQIRVEPAVAAAVLAAYTILSLAVASVVFSRRDVT